MFQRAGFLGPVRMAALSHRPPAVSRRLGGMLEDYNREINELKDKLSRLQKPYMQPAPPPSAYPFSSELPPSPPYTPPPQPPPGEPNCFTRPDGSTYYGYPDGISTPNNLPETWCVGAGSRPLEPEPPPTITSEVDYPGTGMPPISVEAGDEVPPPVPTLPPAFPGGHAPVSTGIPYGEEGKPPISYPPVPTEDELRERACPEVGTAYEYADGTCPPGMSKTVPGSPCCYPDVATEQEEWRRYPPPITSMVPNLFDGGGVSAPMLTGRRTYPVVNLGRRRML